MNDDCWWIKIFLLVHQFHRLIQELVHDVSKISRNSFFNKSENYFQGLSVKKILFKFLFDLERLDEKCSYILRNICFNEYIP